MFVAILNLLSLSLKIHLVLVLRPSSEVSNSSTLSSGVPRIGVGEVIVKCCLFPICDCQLPIWFLALCLCLLMERISNKNQRPNTKSQRQNRKLAIVNRQL